MEVLRQPEHMFQLMENAGKIKAPTQIVWGEYDYVSYIL